MTAQRKNSAAGTTDIAQQQLQDRSATNDLNALGMLCPTERITNRRTLVGTRSGNQGVRNFMKKRWRNAANFLYDLWRITSEVAAQSLENALRMLQGQIALGETKVSM